jgi:hypothetical protein
MLLSSRCVAAIWGYTYRHADLWEGYMKHAVEMGSGIMIHIASFIQKLIGGDSQTHSQHGNVISPLLLFQNKESRLTTYLILKKNAQNIEFAFPHRLILNALCLQRNRLLYGRPLLVLGFTRCVNILAPIGRTNICRY